jgi:hypothetical protein
MRLTCTCNSNPLKLTGQTWVICGYGCRPICAQANHKGRQSAAARAISHISFVIWGQQAAGAAQSAESSRDRAGAYGRREKLKPQFCLSPRSTLRARPQTTPQLIYNLVGSSKYFQRSVNERKHHNFQRASFDPSAPAPKPQLACCPCSINHQSHGLSITGLAQWLQRPLSTKPLLFPHQARARHRCAALVPAAFAACNQSLRRA